MTRTLEHQARAHDNDYTGLESYYRQVAGSELVADPYGSARKPLPGLTLSASIVIPAWNAADTIEQCLIAIEQSSFNHKYPTRLEVIVVDDGSTDGTWDVLQQLDLGLRLVAVQQAHHSRAQTQNTGIAIAGGDVIVSCDADMILSLTSIEELVKRHQVLDDVMLLGFRADVPRDDPRIRPAALRDALPGMLPLFHEDLRLSYGAWGWPESMCRDSDHLKRLRHDKPIVMADGSRWNLPGIVYGALFSLRRRDFAAMDGYDERFHGWGCEDTLVGVRALALGLHIVPVYSAAGRHIAHADRSKRKRQEFAANRRVYQSILRAPFDRNEGRWLERAPARILRRFERSLSSPAANGSGHMEQHRQALADELAEPGRHGKYLAHLGRYGEAADAFAQVHGAEPDEAWAAFDRAKALRAAGRHERALELLEAAATSPFLADSPWPAIELALNLASLGRFSAAHEHLARARALDPVNPAIGFLVGRTAVRHLERAAFYVRLGEYALAVRDYEAALILDPAQPTARAERSRILAQLGRAEEGRVGRAARRQGPAPQRGAERGRPGALAWLEVARMHLAQDQLGRARVALSEAARLRSHGREVSRQLGVLLAAAARRYPLPYPARLAAAVQDIPGWLGADEAELLAALALRALAACGETPPTLVEIGRYCGRSTVLLGLAALALGRADACIVAVDEPALGPAPDGRPAGDVLREQIAAHGIAGLATLAPEQEPAPWSLPSRLVFVDGQHDEAGVRGDVARYTPSLATDGLLVFHDYASYFPDVERCVEDLLEGGGWDLVAQAGTLIAL
ncbi:MAG: glycosyltransferase, partial [Anaerolineae bacterium]